MSWFKVIGIWPLNPKAMDAKNGINTIRIFEDYETKGNG
jgi:hypothetical protein